LPHNHRAARGEDRTFLAVLTCCLEYHKGHRAAFPGAFAKVGHTHLAGNLLADAQLARIAVALLPVDQLHLRAVKLQARYAYAKCRREGRRRVFDRLITLQGRVFSRGHEALDCLARHLERERRAGALRRPRVRDLNERFVSRVLPLFKRQTKEVGGLLPQLYLHGLALGDFELALRGLLGSAARLSPASLLRVKTQWRGEYEAWKQRRLDELEVVYMWADGLYVKAGLEDTKAALLVMIGVLTNGQKVILAVESGQRESKESWGMMLRDLRKRGLKPWRCTIADGHLGLWAALGEQYPALVEQRCWNHKITNVLDAMPKKHQVEVRSLLIAMLPADGLTMEMRDFVGGFTDGLAVWSGGIGMFNLIPFRTRSIGWPATSRNCAEVAEVARPGGDPRP